MTKTKQIRRSNKMYLSPERSQLTIDMMNISGII